MKANKFYIQGLNNSGMIRQIEQSINSHDGINAVRVDMEADTVTVDYDDGRYTENDIKKFVTQTGLVVNEIR